MSDTYTISREQTMADPLEAIRGHGPAGWIVALSMSFGSGLFAAMTEIPMGALVGLAGTIIYGLIQYRIASINHDEKLRDKDGEISRLRSLVRMQQDDRR